MSEWTFAQKALLILASLELLWALAGFVAEPSFHIWVLFEEQPAYVFTFPSNVNDAIFHLATAVVFSIVAAIQIGQDRAVTAWAGRPGSSSR